VTEAAEQSARPTTPATPAPPDRNRTTVRRGVRAGLVAGVGVMLLLVPASLGDNPPGGAVILSAGIAAMTLVTAGWLLLAAILDTIAGERMSLRRAIWTAAATVGAMFGPFLLLGALTQAAMRGAGS
jgi:fucose permease